MMADTLRRTPLYDVHRAAGARMVPFAGWEMPVQYSGIMEEHKAVRMRAGLFDVSHMGEVDLAGPGALALIQRLVTNDVGRLAVGQALYSPMCTPEGGIMDDLLVYRLRDAQFMLVVNAANTQADLAWIHGHAGARADVTITDRTADIALLAFQGPLAGKILQRLTPVLLETIAYYWFRTEVDIAGRRALISRTGYTGEDGFEIYAAAEDAVHLWNDILETGRPEQALPAGLGARDTLRLEAGLLLHGNDMDTTVTPLEAGLAWAVKLGKDEFIGVDALRRQKAEGIPRRLIGFTIEERAIARHGFPILGNGRAIGQVTSGSFGPAVEKSIGLGYVPPGHAEPGQRIAVEIRGRQVPAAVARLPFYTRRAKTPA
jgi:aminomethyltransferase